MIRTLATVGLFLAVGGPVIVGAAVLRFAVTAAARGHLGEGDA